MPEYRRSLVPGGTYFFTVVTYERKNILIDQKARNLLRDVWKDVSSRHPFEMVAYCILPNHFHVVMTLPENDSNFSIRIREIKRLFTLRYTGDRPNNISESRIKRKESSVWQRRFWEHVIRDENDLNRHIEYIHFNPVIHGLVDRVCDWESSSFHRFVKDGLYEPGWGESVSIDPDRNYGE